MSRSPSTSKSAASTRIVAASSPGLGMNVPLDWLFRIMATPVPPVGPPEQARTMSRSKSLSRSANTKCFGYLETGWVSMAPKSRPPRFGRTHSLSNRFPLV